jgi:PKD repeat protein
VTGSCTPVLTGSGDSYSDYLTVTCTFDNVPVNSYTVAVTVASGYYAGYAEDVIVVYDPSLGFTTGGGWFYWPGSASPDTGYPGDRTNFGYTMRYNRPRTSIQGNLLLIRHMPDGNIYRLKSNALEGLSLGDTGSFGWASFTGKGTYLEPGWVDPLGNHSFLFYVEDHNEPGNGIDRVWVEVRNGDGIVIPASSMARPASVNAVQLAGGNIVVPHSGGTANQPPTANFSYQTSDLTANFTDLSSDPGGSVVAWAWNFGDGSTSSSKNPSHTYAAGGTFSVQLTVTDNEGATASTTKQLTVSGGGAASQMYIGDLQAASVMNGSNKWNAEVTILVLSDAGTPVAGATVTGSWSAGSSGSGSCTTGALGTCKITKTRINLGVSSVTFTVTNVTHPTLAYNPLLNVETSIVVTRPN